jgi:Na+/glutamate symporter
VLEDAAVEYEIPFFFALFAFVAFVAFVALFALFAFLGVDYHKKKKVIQFYIKYE